jgi:hypothetical protein
VARTDPQPGRLAPRRPVADKTAGDSRPETAVPIILLILLVVLVAQIGFWDTLGALLGAVGVIILFALVLAGALAVAALLVFRQAKRRIGRLDR